MLGNCVVTLSASPMPVEGRTNNSLFSEAPTLSNATRVPSGDHKGSLTLGGLDVSGKLAPVDKSMIQTSSSPVFRLTRSTAARFPSGASDTDPYRPSGRRPQANDPIEPPMSTASPECGRSHS